MISIAMTTYNGEKYLREQIDSILNQTYKDIELVICDDASSDGTKEILKEYADKDSRIKIYFNGKNLGFKKNFEKAISFCTGEYIAFSDQDDFWLPQKLENSLNIFKNNNIKMLSSNSLLTDENLTSLNKTMLQTLGINNIPTENDQLIKHLIHHNFIQGATILAKKEFINKYLPIPEEIIFHDWWFALNAILENSFIYLNEITLKYRQHGFNVTDNSNHDFYSKIKPAKYNRDIILKECTQKLYFINQIEDKINNKDLIKYLEDSRKYYKSLPGKKFNTLQYINKYYCYMEWQYSKLKKFIYIIKRFIGILKFHILFNK